MMEMDIRRATPDDAAGIVAVFNPIIESGRYTTFTTPFSVEPERDYFANLQSRDLLYVAVRRPDLTIVGFQGLSPLPSYSLAFAHVGVMGTFVDLAHRRQGIARRLFATTFVAARGLGYEKIFTFVRAD